MDKYIYRLTLKKDSYTNWENSTYIPLKGEPCFDETNNILKIGNGVDVFKDLEGLGGGSGASYSFLEVDYDANDGDTSVTISDDTELDISSIRVDINGVKLRSNKYTVDKDNNTILNLDDSLNENDWISIEVIYK